MNGLPFIHSITVLRIVVSTWFQPDYFALQQAFGYQLRLFNHIENSASHLLI